MKRLPAGLGAGLLFGTGLTLADATDPQTVLAFLDPLSGWDPRLLFMFLTGAFTHGLLLRLLRRPAPLLAERFDPPVARAVDKRLLAGAALFGTGWGLAGICPGPALTALGSGTPSAVVFTLAMLAGVLLYERTAVGKLPDVVASTEMPTKAGCKRASPSR